MKILVMTFTLHLPSSQSLKDKRSVVKSLLARCRNRFNVSMAEVGALNTYKEAILAAVAVSNSTVLLDQLREKLVEYLQNDYRCMLCDHTSEVW